MFFKTKKLIIKLGSKSDLPVFFVFFIFENRKQFKKNRNQICSKVCVVVIF